MAAADYPVWVNGDLVDHLPVTDRGLAYGDGVFETIRLAPRPVLLQYHMARLASGSERLAIPVNVRDVEKGIASYITAYSPQGIKIIVTRGSGGRGYKPPEPPSPTIIFQGFALPDYPQAWYQQGINLYLCDTPLAVHPLMQGIKHLNRLPQVMARGEFGSDFQEGLMANAEGWFIEGTTSNLFLIKAGRLLMPPLVECDVNGTMQRYIIDFCHRNHIAIEETEQLQRSDLLAADTLFVCNSVFGVWPVQRIMGQALATRCVDSVNLLHRIREEVLSLVS